MFYLTVSVSVKTTNTMQIHLRGTDNCHFQVASYSKFLQFLHKIDNYHFVLVPAKFYNLRNEISRNKNKEIRFAFFSIWEGSSS